MFKANQIAVCDAKTVEEPSASEEASTQHIPSVSSTAKTIARLSLPGLLANRCQLPNQSELSSSRAIKTADGKWPKVITKEKLGDGFVPSSLKTHYTKPPAPDCKKAGLDEIPLLDARLHLVTSGQDDAAMKRNFDYIFNQPVNPIVISLADQKLEQFKTRIPEVQPSHLEQLALLRRGGSETLKHRNAHHSVALANWDLASTIVYETAKRREPATPKAIRNLFIRINTVLMQEIHNSTGGQVRQLNNVWVGPCDTKGSTDPHPSRLAVPGSMVNTELNTLCNEVAEELNLGNVNPILLAARTAMKGISIHPFSDGNGRTCRLIADFVLLRSGLLPACFDDESKNMMVFPRIAPDMNHNTTSAANLMMAALQRSYQQFD